MARELPEPPFWHTSQDDARSDSRTSQNKDAHAPYPQQGFKSLDLGGRGQDQDVD